MSESEQAQQALATAPGDAINPRFLYTGLPPVGYLKVGGFKHETRIAKSGRKWHPPERYDHFVITTTERDATDNLMPDKDIHEKLGPKPSAVPVILLYDDEHLNMPTQFTYYSGTRRTCYGDGNTAMRRKFHKAANETVWENDWNIIACPCKLLNNGCKPVGTLRCLLPDSPTVGGCYQYRTTSWNSISGCLNSMTLIKAATGGILRGVPLQLRLINRAVATPQGNVPMPLVHVEFSGTLAMLYEATREIAEQRRVMLQDVQRLEAQARTLALAGMPALSPEEDAAVAAEFYPDAPDLPPPEDTEESDDEKAMNALGWTEEQKEQFRLRVPDMDDRMRELAEETGRNG
jgi:hypothetical protein